MSRALITPQQILRHICFSMRQYHDMQFFILWVYITQVMGCSMGLQIFCELPEGRWRSTYNEAVRQILTYIVVFLTYSLVQKSAQFFEQILMQI
jgi:hypothetical protein